MDQISDSDKLQQLISLVARVRDAQRLYFRTGGGLGDAKQLEKQLDHWLLVEKNAGRDDQRKLFEEQTL